MNWLHPPQTMNWYSLRQPLPLTMICSVPVSTEVSPQGQVQRGFRRTTRRASGMRVVEDGLADLVQGRFPDTRAFEQLLVGHHVNLPEGQLRHP